MPDVKFYQNFDKDLEYIKRVFSKLREFGSNCFNILLKKYYPECFGKNDEEILKFFKQNKKEIIKRNEIAGEKLKQSWSKIANKFFTKVEKLTGFKWKNEIYYCHISSSFIFGGYKKPNIVVLCPLSQNPVATLAHELIHLHLLDILDKLGIKINKKKLWKVSEIIVPLLLKKTNIKEIQHKKEVGYYKLRPLYEKIKPLWKGDFKEFVLECMKIV